MVDSWFTDLMTNTTADQRRRRCADAAQQRAAAPVVNLAGLDNNDVICRRGKCLQAAIMRFVVNDIPTILPVKRGTKRKLGHGALVREALLDLTGDPFHPFVCGHGHSLKSNTTVV